MTSPFIALVSLPEYWGEEGRRYFLGPWCLFPDHLDRWESLHDCVLPVLWTDQTVFNDASRRVAATVESLLAFLSQYLNHLHSTSYSERYWRILLWAWANNFVAETLDRFLSLCAARDRWGHFDTMVVPLNHLEFLSQTLPRFQKQAFELVRFSAILAFWGQEYPALEFPKHYLRASSPSLSPENTQLIEEGQALALGELVCGFVQYQRADTDALLRTLPVKVTHLDWPAVDSGLLLGGGASPASSRSGLVSMPANDEFDELIRFLLPFYLPTFCLEEFHSISEAVASRFTGHPRLILSGLGCQEGTAFRFLSAGAVESGSRLICIQHGAMYSTYDQLPCRDFEQQISDYYVGWGWVEESDRKRNLPSPPLSVSLNRDKERGVPAARVKIVWLVNEICPYLIDFRSSLKSWGSARYFAWQVRFLSAVPADLRRHIIVRFKSQRDYPLYEQLRERFPEISIEGKEVAFDDRMAECRIAVADCSSHVHAQAMIQSPVLLFWDTEIWRETPFATQLTTVLAEAGIHSSSPEGAARRLVECYERADEWWDEPHVRQARERYLTSLFMPATDWQQRWQRYLGVLCDDPSATRGEE